MLKEHGDQLGQILKETNLNITFKFFNIKLKYVNKKDEEEAKTEGSCENIAQK